MTDSGSTSYRKNLEPVNELDGLGDVPEAPSVYTRTGKAAPTEVFPRSPKPQPDTYVNGAAAEPAVAEEPASASLNDPWAQLVDVEVNDTAAPVEAVPAAPAAVDPVTQTSAGRGTIDIGLLILRLVLGALLIITSVETFFQLGGNPGLPGLEEQFGGYSYPNILAIALPTLQLAAGVFLALGLLTPVAAMLAIAATGFESLHLVAASENGANAFTWNPAVWLAIVLLGMALSVQFTGPGIFSIDFGRSWARRPMTSSWICGALGIAAAILMWWFL
nr:DoxX [Streptococcus thermophilus]